MFIDFATIRRFGAPAERDVLKDELVELHMSLRWSEGRCGSRVL